MNIALRYFSIALLLAMNACNTPPSQSFIPQTAAELSGGKRTSSYLEVQTFIRGLEALPHGHKLHATTFGSSFEGRPMQLVIAADPPLQDLAAVRASSKLRLLVNANIHAGEVEGKEAVQMILREIALGAHKELLEDAVILFVPIYNADGNERFDRHNRATQNGPEDGVGIRPNAQGLDLNRDFLKAEAPETRALLALMCDTDPHLFMDLHTTNGSYHGYHLTYAPSLSTNVDTRIDGFNRGTLLPEVRRRMLAAHDYRVFDYGNFTGQQSGEWVTYDHRPRFGTNYVGLRNRFSVLSEAYSYVDFPTRIQSTRAFVLEVLGSAVRHGDTIIDLCAAADANVTAGDWSFGFDSHLGDAIEEIVLVGTIEELVLPEDFGTRRMWTDQITPTQMPVRRGFQSDLQIAAPKGWLIPNPSARVIELLELHGVEFNKTHSEEILMVENFVPSEVNREKRIFQGHHELSLVGSWQKTERLLPPGSLFISASQPLARVAAQLLEPNSEDSLATWDQLLGWEEALADQSESSPVWRLSK
ncbi:MAG: M14 family metallopeptidase [Planctomycetes bacterium]|nr:M14 family metallopeptidase [Planctomycetota bacterium]MCP4860667.1 M14 family metallopeptidase [Planctomycetota bacterium]